MVFFVNPWTQKGGGEMGGEGGREEEKEEKEEKEGEKTKERGERWRSIEWGREGKS